MAVVKTFMGATRALFVKRFGLSDRTPTDYGFDNNVPLNWRNAANTADIETMKVDADGMIQIDKQAVKPAMKKTLQFNLSTNASLLDQCFFISDGSYTITGITEIHAVAGNHASAVTANITKETGTTAPAAGSSVMSGTFNMKGTANTLQTATLSSVAGVLDLVAGDRLSINFTGDIQTLAGVVVEITLTPAAKQETVVFSMLANGDLEDQSFYIANRPMIVTDIRYVHSVLGTDASAVNLQVTKDTGTNAPGAGTDLLTNNTNAGFNGKAAINTVQTGTLTATAATLRLAAGDRLSVDFAGTLTALAGVVVVVTMQPIYDRKEVSFTLAKNGNLADQGFFIADRAYEVIAASEVHATAGGDGGAVNLQLTIDKGTDAPGAGVDLLSNNASAGFNLKGTANTVQVGTFVNVNNNIMLPGDRLSLDFAGVLTTLAGVTVTVSLKPV